MSESPKTPAAPSGLSDLELLRRYEPVLRFTRGEQFFPMDVAQYVGLSSLWVHRADGRDEVQVKEGALNLEALAEPRAAEFGAVHYLKFIEPLNLAELTRLRVREGVKRLRRREPGFRAGLGRLARVGYGPRLLDALFSLTLLLRGRVPGDTAAAAGLTYRRLQRQAERYVYYGRAARESGWVILQYWFFYPFNNWRSGFQGANDHEADWEMVLVYLYPGAEGSLIPHWAAYASHEFRGSDLRRRWDDQEELELLDGHPVVYVGAGSHAAYFRRGEFLTEIELSFFTPIRRLYERLQAFWVQTLRQSGLQSRPADISLFRVPFVDYARGDGVSVGPGGEKTWSPMLLDPAPAWVTQYRGLWGLHARDPISGENAPAGPMYNRDGTVRSAWYDPLGWAGLDRVPPPPLELELLHQRQQALRERQEELGTEIGARSREIQEIGVELASLQGNPHLTYRNDALQEKLKSLRAALKELRKERAQTVLLLEASEGRQGRLERGEADPPRAHIRHRQEPPTEYELRLGRLAELWAALSIGLLLLGVVALFAFRREFLGAGLLALGGGFVFVEAVFRRQVQRLVAGLTLVLAIISALVLAYEFFWEGLAALAVAAGLYLVWQNLRELRR